MRYLGQEMGFDECSLKTGCTWFEFLDFMDTIRYHGESEDDLDAACQRTYNTSTSDQFLA